ncbi:hypothetical protein D9M71_572940 [compost metagenome]
MKVAEGVGLAQAQLAAARLLPEHAVQTRFDALVHGGAGVEFLGRSSLHDFHSQQFMANLRVVPSQVPVPKCRVASCTEFQCSGRLVLHFDR